MESGPQAQAGRNPPGLRPRYEAVVDDSSDFLRQKSRAATVAAPIPAIALLFSPAWSPLPGATCFAFRLAAIFVTCQTPQPSRALRRLKMDMGSPFPTGEPSKRPGDPWEPRVQLPGVGTRAR